jgi:hypothetical protein
VKVAVDLDHTLLGSYVWPGLGEWLPGAKEALRELVDAGHTVYIFTYRTSQTGFGGTDVPMTVRFAQMDMIRNLLDDADLTEVGIFDGHGKPYYDLLIDDRAMRFPRNRKNAWLRIMPAVHARLKGA